nr:carotenoid 9,10(9',10')-cleavage dioxygenase 1 [Quercus suber]
MRFNMKTGLASQKKLSTSAVGFPRVNESYTGSPFVFHLLKSSVNVLDAKTMSANPVAVVEIPHRVPPGFHAFFVTEVTVTSIAYGLNFFLTFLCLATVEINFMV